MLDRITMATSVYLAFMVHGERLFDSIPHIDFSGILLFILFLLNQV